MSKHKKIDLKEIMKKNPHIKKSDLQKYEEMKKDLQKLGFTARGYRLPAPYEWRFINADDDFDPRTIDLSAAYF